jgi:ABC-type multidrug transport system ATPase subunit
LIAFLLADFEKLCTFGQIGHLYDTSTVIRVFSLFDRILLMAEGRTAFLGPAVDALPFFSNLGFLCPPSYNPAEFYIHTLATKPSKEAESKERRNIICNAYEVFEASHRVFEIAEANKIPISSISTGIRPSENETEGRKVKKSSYKASVFDQFRAVVWRSVISVIHESMILKFKSFQLL